MGQPVLTRATNVLPQPVTLGVRYTVLDDGKSVAGFEGQTLRVRPGAAASWVSRRPMPGAWRARVTKTAWRVCRYCLIEVDSGVEGAANTERFPLVNPGMVRKWGLTLCSPGRRVSPAYGLAGLQLCLVG